MASPSIAKTATRRARPKPEIDWRKVAYHTLVSRALDDLEEETNRNRTKVPK
jgi:2-oxoisovalerate dehydrogenase E1 component